jgi:hypothetical protein
LRWCFCHDFLQKENRRPGEPAALRLQCLI